MTEISAAAVAALKCPDDEQPNREGAPGQRLLQRGGVLTARPITATFHAIMDNHSHAISPAATEVPEVTDEVALAAAAAMFRALADPERLRLLVRLASGEACVTDLADESKLTTVSARLQTLHAVRLVSRRRDSRHIYYALADQHVLDLVKNAMEHAGEHRTPVPRGRPIPATKKKGTLR